MYSVYSQIDGATLCRYYTLCQRYRTGGAVMTQTIQAPQLAELLQENARLKREIARYQETDTVQKQVIQDLRRRIEIRSIPQKKMSANEKLFWDAAQELIRQETPNERGLIRLDVSEAAEKIGSSPDWDRAYSRVLPSVSTPRTRLWHTPRRPGRNAISLISSQMSRYGKLRKLRSSHQRRLASRAEIAGALVAGTCKSKSAPSHHSNSPSASSAAHRRSIQYAKSIHRSKPTMHLQMTLPTVKMKLRKLRSSRHKSSLIFFGDPQNRGSYCIHRWCRCCILRAATIPARSENLVLPSRQSPI